MESDELGTEEALGAIAKMLASKRALTDEEIERDLDELLKEVKIKVVGVDAVGNKQYSLTPEGLKYAENLILDALGRGDMKVDGESN